MGRVLKGGLEQPPLDPPLERFLAAGFGMAQGQEQRVLLRAFRRLCGSRLNTAVGIRQAQPPHGFPVRYRLHPCSATAHSHRRAALKPFLPASRYVAYTQMSTPTIYIENPAPDAVNAAVKLMAAARRKSCGDPNSGKLSFL